MLLVLFWKRTIQESLVWVQFFSIKVNLPRSGTNAFGSFLEKNNTGVINTDIVFFNKSPSSAKRNKRFWFFSRKEQYKPLIWISFFSIKVHLPRSGTNAFGSFLEKNDTAVTGIHTKKKKK
jgi:hypothetical protein